MPINYQLLNQYCHEAAWSNVIKELRNRDDLEPLNAEKLTKIATLIEPLYEAETNIKKKQDYKQILWAIKEAAVFDYSAIEQHVRDANLVAIKRLFLSHNNIFPIDQEKFKTLVELIKTQLYPAANKEQKNIYDNILHILENGSITLTTTDNTNREKLRVYSSKETAHKAEALSQKKVSDRFWRVGSDKPLKANSPADTLYHLITQELSKLDAARKPIALDGYSFRALILALVKIFPKNIGYHRNPGYPMLKFSIGESIIVCDPAGADGGKDSQMANHWVRVEQLPEERFTYGNWKQAATQGVYNYLSDLCGGLTNTNGRLREQQLAIFLREKSHTIASFSEHNFNEQGLIRIEGEAPFSLEKYQSKFQKDSAQRNLASKIHYLNGLLFLYSECEVARRLYRTSTGNVFSYSHRDDPKPAKSSDQIPMGILQARSLELLAQGMISLNDLFGHSTETYGKAEWVERRPISGDALHRAEYGVATGRSTIKNLRIMQQKAAKVNQTVESKITRNLHAFFVDIDPTLERVRLPIKEGRNKLKMTLGNHYGGLYDGNSSGDDYSDDDVPSLEQNMSGLKMSGK